MCDLSAVSDGMLDVSDGVLDVILDGMLDVLDVVGWLSTVGCVVGIGT